MFHPLTTDDEEGGTGTTTDDGAGGETGGGSATTGGSSSGGGGGSTSGSTHSCPVSDKNANINYVFSVSAGRKRHTAAGTEVVFDATPKLKSGDKGLRVDYRWSFGDGYSGRGKRVAHTYSFPGDYLVVLNAVQGEEEAVSRTEVRVDKSALVISRVNQVTGVIEISNQATSEINLGSWRVIAGDKAFVFPTDTILKSKNQIVLAPALTGFGVTDCVGPISVLAQDGQVISQFGAPPIVRAVAAPNPGELLESEMVVAPIIYPPEADNQITGPTGERVRLEEPTTSPQTILPASVPLIIEKRPSPLSKVSGSIKNLFREVFQ